jgi:hypothetical protein
MPPEYQAAAGLSVDNWLTIFGFLLTIGVQSFTFWRWLSKELEARDKALLLAGSTTNQQIDQLTDKFNAQLKLMDRDISNLRTDLSVALAKLPTRDMLDAMLQARVGPIDAEVRSLTLELARAGLQLPARPSAA